MKLFIFSIYIITQVLILIQAALKKRTKKTKIYDVLERNSDQRQECCTKPYENAKKVEKEMFMLLKEQKKKNRNFLEDMTEYEEEVVDVENDFEDLKNKMKA